MPWLVARRSAIRSRAETRGTFRSWTVLLAIAAFALIPSGTFCRSVYDFFTRLATIPNADFLLGPRDRDRLLAALSRALAARGWVVLSPLLR